ncbi:hypothetical protein [Streptomyces sp. S.PB5]|uniref:hypothetical protein n=1 Tax=Streptomyces sp. S.PB5 TaxID=3020844 RepID=UPI0025B02522|nr:hypothetical protein [Streptomyces sp. S.PB5]MDN3028587.1 hypothetical protein [Streptomyces sp. S.PB5]
MGEIRAAVAIWQQLTEEALPDHGVRDYLLNISSAVQEDADPQFDTAVTRWLQDLASRAFDEGNLTNDSFFALFCNLVWWVGGRLDGGGDHQQAKSIAQAIVDQVADILSPDHDGVLWARQIIAHQEGRLGNRALAFALNLEIADILASVYGEDHPLTRDARVDVTRWQSAASE